jgi:probable HAF family extracellular repeat protein
VGQSSLATGFNLRPFVYKDGVMKDLGTFGGDIGYARDVNNRDVVVGDSRDSTGRFLAFMTDGSGVLRPFLDLPGDQTCRRDQPARLDRRHRRRQGLSLRGRRSHDPRRPSRSERLVLS